MARQPTSIASTTNGNGYPLGLAVDEIPLAAPIVALADVYDALTCKRVYKSAYSHPEEHRPSEGMPEPTRKAA